MFPGDRWLRTLCSIALLISCAAVFHAQARTASPEAPLVVKGLGRGTVALDGQWQFHLGDDLAWASPGFDDSHWEQIDISRPWGDQGHWGYSGFAWYRRQIEIKDEPGGAVDLALFVPIASTSYEVYWNGRMIGSTDRMPEPSPIYPTSSQMFRLGRPASGVLAFRTLTIQPDSTMYGDQFGLAAVPRVGNIEAITNLQARERASVIRSKFLDVAQMVTYAQLFLIGLLVWLQNRGQKLLFWMTAFFFSAGFWALYNPVIFPWESTSFFGQIFSNPMHSLEDVALWFLLLYLLDLDRYPWLMRLARILACIALVSALIDTLIFWSDWSGHILTYRILDAVFTAGFSVPQIFPLILIPYAFSKRLDLARRVVAVTAFLSDMYFVVWHSAIQGQLFTRWTLGDTMQLPMFNVKGIAISAPDILSLLLLCAIVYAVYRYTIEQSQRQIALEQEQRNARAVQQVLIPEAFPAVTGFAIDSVYKPAGEVGGDFFQILATRDGGVLAVIGDVSGKGMPAAMTVSLLVGTVRTLAHYSQSPGEILAAMNQRMLGRSQGGFTTCLVLRADADGALTVANAGHVAPYLAGKELPLENSLPLGLAAEATYVESIFQLAPGEQLTLLTDGVVEAREKTGTLFGFGRTAALSIQPAEAIAQTAQAFGQYDDITVLTLTRLAAGDDVSTAQYTAPILSPA